MHTMAFFNDEWGNDELREGDYDMNESNILLSDNEGASIQNDSKEVSIDECRTSAEKIETDLDKTMETASTSKVAADPDETRETASIDKVEVDPDNTGKTASIGNVEVDLDKTGETMSADKVEVDLDKTEETASVDINIEAGLGKTMEMENYLNQCVGIGYVHNISPVKAGNYFDFVLQTKSKTICAVCFSPPKRKSFVDHSSWVSASLEISN